MKFINEFVKWWGYYYLFFGVTIVVVFLRKEICLFFGVLSMGCYKGRLVVGALWFSPFF